MNLLTYPRRDRTACLTLTAAGQCKLLGAVPYAVKKRELPFDVFHHCTTIVTASARDGQGTEIGGAAQPKVQATRVG